MAERLKKMLPPNLLDDKKQGDIPPQIKAQLDQSHQMIEQLTEALKKKTEETEGKVLELESRERIEFKKLENALVLKQLDLQGAAANALFAAELASIRDRLSLVDMGSPVGHEQEPQQPPQNQNQNQNFNESVPQGNAIQNEQPTGGFSPGQSQEF